MQDVTCLHLIIHGRVQGVGYRAWTGSKARALGLRGWVRNRRDDTVEAVIAGPDAAVKEMVEACYKGPIAARVDQIETTLWTQDVPEGFVKRDTL